MAADPEAEIITVSRMSSSSLIHAESSKGDQGYNFGTTAAGFIFRDSLTVGRVIVAYDSLSTHYSEETGALHFQKTDAVEKCHQIGKNSWIITAGIVKEVTDLVNVLREKAKAVNGNFTASDVAEAILAEMKSKTKECTIQVLVFGFEEHLGPLLYHVGRGVSVPKQTCTIGSGGSHAQVVLDTYYKKGEMTVGGAAALAAEAICVASRWDIDNRFGISLTGGDVTVLSVGPEGFRAYGRRDIDVLVKTFGC